MSVKVETGNEMLMLYKPVRLKGKKNIQSRVSFHLEF